MELSHKDVFGKSATYDRTEYSVQLPWTMLREPATYLDWDRALKVRVGRADVLSAQVATPVFGKALASDRTAPEAMSPPLNLSNVLEKER